MFNKGLQSSNTLNVGADFQPDLHQHFYVNFSHQNPLSRNLSPAAKLKPTIYKQRKPVIPQNAPIKAVHVDAPDGIVLSGNVPDSVVIKTQQRLINDAKQYTNGDRNSARRRESVQDSQLRSNDTTTVRESPIQPDSSTRRPSSALKFRSMVMSSRAGGQ